MKSVPQADAKSASMGWFFDPGFIQNVQRVAADVEDLESRHNALRDAVAWERECGAFHYCGWREQWWNGCLELHDIRKSARSTSDRLLGEDNG